MTKKTNDPVHVRRLPFSRADIVRLKQGKGECKWCGSSRALYKYGIEPDAGLTGWFEGQFCCIGCCDSYHGPLPKS